MREGKLTSRHRIVFADSRQLGGVDSASVDLVITSPPYPMIQMWDELFSRLNPRIGELLHFGRGQDAFEAMHAELDSVWRELWRVVKNGGIVCINVGDAVRTVGGEYRLYANHARILEACTRLGFHPLPQIIWRKPANSPNKFLGSGTLPPGAYVTLEHEWILIFRKNGLRRFTSGSERRKRRRSAFFWEERNLWFSDLWELKGVRQDALSAQGRRRTAAFPFELAYRLISMFSVKGDLVFDPFLGSGTTMIAAMCAARSSLGVEIDERVGAEIDGGLRELVPAANRWILARLEQHLAFVEQRSRLGKTPKHVNETYGFPVVSRQETELLLDYLLGMHKVSRTEWRVEYSDQPPPQNASETG